MLSSRLSSSVLQQSVWSKSASFLCKNSKNVMYNKRNFASANPRKFFVINAVGLDRPGIVSDMCEVVTNAGGNIGESRAVRLGDHFTLMMLADIPSSESRSVQESLAHISGIYTSTFETSDPNEVKITPKLIYEGELTLSGADHPGIVHHVTSTLSKYNLSIEDLETSQKEAPFGGTTLFLMKCSVTATDSTPGDIDIAAVKKDIEKLADSFNCDIDLEEVA